MARLALHYGLVEKGSGSLYPEIDVNIQTGSPNETSTPAGTAVFVVKVGRE